MGFLTLITSSLTFSIFSEAFLLSFKISLSFVCLSNVCSNVKNAASETYENQTLSEAVLLLSTLNIFSGHITNLCQYIMRWIKMTISSSYIKCVFVFIYNPNCFFFHVVNFIPVIPSTCSSNYFVKFSVILK